jgi:hypothetical protein
MSQRFYLTQRLRRREESRQQPERGFDGFFDMEYMGSAEYEFDTPSTSLKSMRSERLVIRQKDITIGDVTRPVFFIGHEATLEARINVFRFWVSAAGIRFKDNPRFEAKFLDVADEYNTTDAWWAFGDDIAWALDKDTAEALLVAFNTTRDAPVKPGDKVKVRKGAYICSTHPDGDRIAEQTRTVTVHHLLPAGLDTPSMVVWAGRGGYWCETWEWEPV